MQSARRRAANARGGECGIQVARVVVDVVFHVGEDLGRELQCPREGGERFEAETGEPGGRAERRRSHAELGEYRDGELAHGDGRVWQHVVGLAGRVLFLREVFGGVANEIDRDHVESRITAPRPKVAAPANEALFFHRHHGANHEVGSVILVDFAGPRIADHYARANDDRGDALPPAAARFVRPPISSARNSSSNSLPPPARPRVRGRCGCRKRTPWRSRRVFAGAAATRRNRGRFPCP